MSPFISEKKLIFKSMYLHNLNIMENVIAFHQRIKWILNYLKVRQGCRLQENLQDKFINFLKELLVSVHLEDPIHK